MAKSIRSKRKRKLRNIKRAKNAPRELQRLKKCLNIETSEDTDNARKGYDFSDIREMINKEDVNQATGAPFRFSKIPGVNYFGMETQESIEGKPRKETRKRKQKVNKEMEVDNEDKADNDADTSGMEVDSKRNLKTLKNEHGNYPKWMNHRKIKKARSKNAHGKVKRKNVIKKRIAW